MFDLLLLYLANFLVLSPSLHQQTLPQFYQSVRVNLSVVAVVIATATSAVVVSNHSCRVLKLLHGHTFDTNHFTVQANATSVTSDMQP